MTNNKKISIFDIKDPAIIKSISPENLDTMIEESRDLIIKSSLANGGHWGANTSILETTAAIVRNFDLDHDKILFDIGHNCYTYKIFTGRANRMKDLRNLKGLKGFQDMFESKYDVINQGNAGTASSIGLGMAAADVDKDNYIVTIVGDSSFGNGNVFEYFNHTYHINKPMIFILNDNSASIGPTVGCIQGWTNGKNQNMQHKIPLLAKLFDFKILGPIDGHDWRKVETILKEAKKINKQDRKSVLIYLLTEKGYKISNKLEDVGGSKLHAIGRPGSLNVKWDSFISDIIVQKMRQNDKIDIVSSAMIYPMYLNKAFGDKQIKNVAKDDAGFQRRVYNAGIAEGHAAAFAAGLAKSGRIPYLPFQSAFARRAFDQILHDMAITHRHVVIGLAEAGVIENGNTHHGFYDLAMFNAIPNTRILQPANKAEMQLAYDLAFDAKAEEIWVIRYAKWATPYELNQTLPNNFDTKTASKPLWITYSHKKASKIAIISYGQMVAHLRSLIIEEDLPVDVISALWLKPIDEKTLYQTMAKYDKVILVEDNVRRIGLDAIIAQFVDIQKLDIWSYPHDAILEFGEEESVRAVYDLDYEGLRKRLKKLF